jgi:hypothetical protein
MVKTRSVSAIQMVIINSKALCFHIWLKVHVNKVMYN